MTARIRRAVVAVALTLLAATALAGVAWAANTIHCPGESSSNLDGTCEGTDRNDVMYGTRAPVIEIDLPLGSRCARRSPPHPKH